MFQVGFQFGLFLLCPFFIRVPLFEKQSQEPADLPHFFKEQGFVCSDQLSKKIFNYGLFSLYFPPHVPLPFFRLPLTIQRLQPSFYTRWGCIPDIPFLYTA